MKLTKSEIIELLKNEGNKFNVTSDSGHVGIDRIQLYAAMGYMESTGTESVSFDATGCACLPGSPCYPKCAE